ncbi:hypothetical protein DOY81_006920 [Sarcophaga bullata]|nr:hypothetical protein DOY81_006920 [Sarcophaga bullata]
MRNLWKYRLHLYENPTLHINPLIATKVRLKTLRYQLDITTCHLTTISKIRYLNIKFYNFKKFCEMCSYYSILISIAMLHIVRAGPVFSPEVSTNTENLNNHVVLQQKSQQMQHQKSNINQNPQLNSLNVYASNFDVISNNQNDQFKPSYKLPEMETNFTPIHNSNSITTEFASTLSSPTPVLIQYLPQTINEGGVQYLQLIPTRPLMVPIAPYLSGNTGGRPITYHQHLAPSKSIDYTVRPLISGLPVNLPPPVPTTLVDLQSTTLPSYGIQSYAGSITSHKQNHRINRETKDKNLLGPISLNLNEYLPGANSQQQSNLNTRGRP